MYSVPKKADYELSIPDIRDIFSDRLFHSIEQEFFFFRFLLKGLFKEGFN